MPPVYEGAPAPVTAFVATVSKGAMFALLLRYLLQVNGYRYGSVVMLFGLIAVASMFIGNFLALLQQNVKRILAYSSIAHLGYVLVAFLASGAMAVEAVTYYLVAYFVTMLGAFSIVTVMSRPGSDADSLEEYQGLFWRRLWLAGIFTLMLLSLAGIPLTAGFFAKFYVIAAGVASGLWLLVLFLIINSVIGLFYYLRVIVAMAAAVRPVPALMSWSWAEHVALAVLAALLIWLGIYPAPMIRLIQAMGSSIRG